MSTTIKSNTNGSSAIQTGGVDRIQIDSSGVPLLVNTPATGDSTKKIATTEFVANTVVGVGQTWQDFTASRSVGTTYTNSTGRPIMVSVSLVATNVTNTGSILIGGVSVASQGLGNGLSNTWSLIVPAGSTYRVNTTNQSILIWSELR